MFAKLIFLSLAASLIPIACPADSLTVQFNIACCINSGQFFTSPSAGSLTLNLLSNGEIGANLQSNGGSILGLGFEGNGATNHDFSPIIPVSQTTTVSASDFGEFSDGFGCAPSGCGQQESFLIGNPGQFSSVYQLVGTIGGGIDPIYNPTKVNFFFAMPGGEAFQFGADVAPVPEPATKVFLLFAGFALLIAPMNRRLFRGVCQS